MVVLLRLGALIISAAAKTFAAEAHAQSVAPTGFVTPLKRQAPSPAASIAAMQRALANGPRRPLPEATEPRAMAVQGPVNLTVAVAAVRPLDTPAGFKLAAVRMRVTIASRTHDVDLGSTLPNAPGTTVQTVPPGRIPVRLEIFDGPSTERPIDFNRAADKRHHDFIVDTATCRVLGFAGTPVCGEQIQRAGTQARRAEVTFSVAVSR